MTNHKRTAAVVGALLLCLALGALLNAPALLAQARQPFEWIIARQLTVNTDATINDDLTVAGDATVVGTLTAGTLAATTASPATMNVTGNASVAGTFAANGNFSVGALVNIPYASTVITNGTVLTPTETFLALAPTVESTITLGTGTNGQFVILYNDSAQTIHLADTGNAKLSAAWAPGQTDVLGLGYITSVGWVEWFRSNN